MENWEINKPRKCASNPEINCVCWKSGVCQGYKSLRNNINAMQVTKTNWSREEFSWEKIEAFYKRAAHWYNTKCPFSHLKENVANKLIDWIKTSDLTKQIEKGAIDLITPESPEWSNIAGRMKLRSLYKRASSYKGINNSDLYTPEYFLELTKEYVDRGLYHNCFKDKYTEEELLEAWKFLDQKIDETYNFPTVQYYERRYLLNRDWIIRELPQHLYLAVSLFLNQDETENRLQKVKDLYRATAEAKISLPTPTLLNARTPNCQLSSCFILDVDDDLRGIYHQIENMAQISKNWWGLWVYMWNVRSKGSPIKWVYWLSWWTTPWIKVINDTAVAVNQMGKRAWAISVTLDIFHRDIYHFLDLQTETGDIRGKSFDIFPAVSFPDLFFKRLEEDSTFTLFCPYEVEHITGIRLQDLWWEEFEEAYRKLEADQRLQLKEVVWAKDLFKTFLKATVETWMPYTFFRDTVNKLNPNKHAWIIHCSNLCVSWDTKILTKDWYEEIEWLVGQTKNIWNWKEWSKVEIMQTWKNQKLIEVETNTGQSIKCTPYHKFYRDNWEEVRAVDLKKWDKLIKFNLPVIHWQTPLKSAYQNWFYSWDGTELKWWRQKIYLYWEKKNLDFLFPQINFRKNWNRLEWETDVLKNKFYVPTVDITIPQKLDWLAWLADADWTITNNKWSQSLQIASINKSFLLDIQLLLQTLWVNAKVTKMRENWIGSLPKNDWSGECWNYPTKEIYRLLINWNWLFQLAWLWFKTYRLKWEIKKPNRECSLFIKITNIVNVDWLHNTYCFTEPKRHMWMFNGILTGQCTEIAQNQSAPKFKEEIRTENWDVIIVYKPWDTVICNLASINIAKVNTKEEMEKIFPIVTRALDNVISLNAYPIEEARITAEKYRAIWIGYMWVAEYLATNHINYWSPESVEIIDWLFKQYAYYTLKASCELSKERWAYPAFQWSDFSKGIAFWRSLQDIANDDWDALWCDLQDDIIKWWVRFGYHSAPAPNTSTAWVVGTTAWVVPTYKRFFVETNQLAPTVTVAPNLSPDNFWYYKEYTHLKMDWVIDLVCAIQKWIDQSVSFEWMINPQNTSPADVYKYYLQAWKGWLKTVYYVRSLSLEIEDNCASCSW